MRSSDFLFSAAGEHANNLWNQYQGASCFLVCGGPSLNETPLDSLNERGVVVAAVNQVAATHVRPHLWFTVDEPSHFHESIWTDPGIMKFIREDRATNQTFVRDGTRWQPTRRPARDYPNVWTYRFCNGFKADEFLTSPVPIWGGRGNLGGKPRDTRSVMLVALRLLHYLGFRTVYLVGCDFSMRPEATYAFDDPKDARACEYNNDSYRQLAVWFAELRPHFERHGFNVLNATVGGELEAFERVDFCEAIERVKIDRPASVRGHYRKGN